MSIVNTETKRGIFNQVYDYLFGKNIMMDDDDERKEPRRILCTGKWREFEERRLLMESHLGHLVTPLSQENEGILQAQCAHKIMVNEGRITPMDEDIVYLYLGAGRGSTQFTLLDSLGDFVNAYNVPTGYPKNGAPDLEILKATSQEIHETFGNSVVMIVAFDSIYHVLKEKKCPVVPDGCVLSYAILQTSGRDFLDLGYLTDLYMATPMLVVRNFITIDGNTRKISFATGDELLIDLGTGNANLVDPVTGTQFENRELPGDWMTNDDSLIKVSKQLRELLDIADQYDDYDDDSASETASETASEYDEYEAGIHTANEIDKN